MSKLLLILVIFGILACGLSSPQIEHGSLLGPSGRFERTMDQAVKPLPADWPPIVLPEATPIHEDVNEGVQEDAKA